MRKTEILEVLRDYEDIYTALEKAKKGSPIVPSMNEFLQLLLIKRLGGIEGELDCILQNLEWLKNIDDELDDLKELIAMDLDEQDTREFVQKMLDADDEDDAREFLERVENAEDPE